MSGKIFFYALGPAREVGHLDGTTYVDRNGAHGRCARMSVFADEDNASGWEVAVYHDADVTPDDLAAVFTLRRERPCDYFKNPFRENPNRDPPAQFVTEAA